MWVGAIRLGVRTGDTPPAGTDNLVLAHILRDDNEIAALRLDYADENDLERGAFRNYYYSSLPRRNDRTPTLPDGIGQNPMPYPDRGLEFSSGLAGHLKIRLSIGGDDLWLKDNVDLFIKEIRNVATSFDTLAWVTDPTWEYVGTWSRDVVLSQDPAEGTAAWTLVF
jgi:hypothetical protein